MNRFYKAGICILLCLGMMLACCACSNEKKTVSEKELMQQGMNLIEQMDILAESGAYSEKMTSSETVSSMIQKFGKEDFAEPEKVSRITLPPKAFDTWFSKMSGKSLPEEVREPMEKKMLSGIFGTINGATGVDMMAVSSILAMDNVFDAGTQQQNQLWVYQFPGDYSVIISFIFQKDGLAEASAYPVSNEFFSDMEGGFAQWLEKTLWLEDLTEEEIAIS